MSSTIKFLDLSLHDLIDKLNPELRSINNFDGKERKREFYAMSPEGHEILDEETAAEVAKEAKCGSFRFSAVGIPVGATIHYINDESKSIIATVLDDRHISYKGVTTSMSAVAAELLNVEGTIQGILHMRERIEEKR